MKLPRPSLLQGISLAFLALLVFAITQSTLLPDLLDHLTRLQTKVVSLHLWGQFLYPFLIALCNLLLLPGGILTVGSGLFFGLRLGFLLSLLGNLLGAAIALFLSRTFARHWIAKKFLLIPKWAALDQAIALDGWKIIFLSQIHPLFPTSLLNYLYGISKVRFQTALFWIALGQSPGLFFYAYLGSLTEFSLRFSKGQTHPTTTQIILAFSGLIPTFALTVLLAKIALRTLATATTPPKISNNQTN